MKLKQNHVPRDIIMWYDLTAAEQREFDWLDTDDKRNEATFFRYKGVVYALSEFMSITPAIAPHCQRPGWEKFDGYHSDSFFSGVLVRYVEDWRVIAATYYC